MNHFNITKDQYGNKIIISDVPKSPIEERTIKIEWHIGKGANINVIDVNLSETMFNLIEKSFRPDRHKFTNDVVYKELLNNL